jgi:hypothetical protein
MTFFSLTGKKEFDTPRHWRYIGVNMKAKDKEPQGFHDCLKTRRGKLSYPWPHGRPVKRPQRSAGRALVPPSWLGKRREPFGLKKPGRGRKC